MNILMHIFRIDNHVCIYTSVKFVYLLFCDLMHLHTNMYHPQFKTQPIILIKIERSALRWI